MVRTLLISVVIVASLADKGWFFQQQTGREVGQNSPLFPEMMKLCDERTSKQQKEERKGVFAGSSSPAVCIGAALFVAALQFKFHLN